MQSLKNVLFSCNNMCLPIPVLRIRMFIPNARFGFFHPGFASATLNWQRISVFLTYKLLLSEIFIPDPGSRISDTDFSIPDPWVKKALNPGSVSATLLLTSLYILLVIMHPCKLQKMQSRETVTFRFDDMRVPAPQSPLPHRRRGNNKSPKPLQPVLWNRWSHNFLPWRNWNRIEVRFRIQLRFWIRIWIRILHKIEYKSPKNLK